MNIDFTGQTVIVTGAGHGFGRAIAHAFAWEGATVWACDVNADGLGETARLAAHDGLKIETRAVDVTNREAVSAFVDELAGITGRVDVLVNNAGGVLGQVGRPLEEISETDWRSIFAVNVDGAFNFAQAVAPHMKRQRSGRIVNISSGAGLGIS
ncbi:SDR family NAD(P)-dependent oxidoreductase, partial [Deinococcus sp.]|uniref:SDR family NAD(P)-dependent oxidoreductase n=1 Tax=Deinococcus sp. TaxID=47478 RepID=UPI002869CD25